MTNIGGRTNETAAEQEGGALSTAEAAAMVTRLEGTGDYKVLRRLAPLPLLRGDHRATTGLRCAIVVDTETTGLVMPGNAAGLPPSEVVSLAMVAIAYDSANGEIKGSIGHWHALREPSHPIPPAATAVHGLTDADVRGRKIDVYDIADFIALAATVQNDCEFTERDEERLPLLIAHNAAFDRQMVEHLWPQATSFLPWTCTQTQVPWARYGFEGLKLSYLAVSAGFFYNDRHSAAADADATVELLRQPLGGRTALARLREAAQQVTHRLYVQTRYDRQTIAALKQRGYRWSGGGDGRPRAWYWDGEQAGLIIEQAWLADVGLDGPQELRTIDCFNRFSCRE